MADLHAQLDALDKNKSHKGAVSSLFDWNSGEEAFFYHTIAQMHHYARIHIFDGHPLEYALKK